MLVLKTPTSINDRSEPKILSFEKCIRQLKYYFSNIEEVQNKLEKGEIVETPYFKFKHLVPSEALWYPSMKKKEDSLL